MFDWQGVGPLLCHALNRQDHLPELLIRLEVMMRLAHVGQRKCPVDVRPQGARGDAFGNKLLGAQKGNPPIFSSKRQ